MEARPTRRQAQWASSSMRPQPSITGTGGLLLQTLYHFAYPIGDHEQEISFHIVTENTGEVD